MYKIFIKGIVQGVGFRPFIFRQCQKEGLRGYVRNISGGVEVVVDNKQKFLNLLKNLPPLSFIEDISVSKISGLKDFKGFEIRKSLSRRKTTLIPPDISICHDCLRELKDEKDPRFGYFFITCTNCGPRYSILKRLPYDRKFTSMASFKMCDFCQREYLSPLNRRFHAQTIACQKCGPKLTLYFKNQPLKTNDPIKETAFLLKKGKIVAIKGVGGFHLACLASCQKTVTRLRFLCQRPNKPFALMVKDLKMAQKICRLNNKEKEVLSSLARPIVVLRKKKNFFPAVSSLNTFGLMLPYSGLHYLLFDYLDEPLIMTSSNLADRPISARLQEQFVDYVLDYNRKIVNKIDDSVIKVIAQTPIFLRRSRGYVPLPIMVKKLAKNKAKIQILALGAEQQNTIAVYKEGKVFISEFLGNLSNPFSFSRFKKVVSNFLSLFQINPDLIVCDLHPDYKTTEYAFYLSKRKRVPLVKVQHHLAHIFSVAFENGFSDFFGVAADGLGFGWDGKIWGGEVFEVKKGKVFRIGHLEEQMLLGGDLAIKSPPRMLFAILAKFLPKELLEKEMRFFYSKKEFEVLFNQYKSGINSFVTTSAGRFLDAVAAFLRLSFERTYEGEPAIKLESFSKSFKNIPKELIFKPKIKKRENCFVLETTPFFKYILEKRNRDKKILASLAEYYLAQGFYKMITVRRKELNNDKRPFVFSGGVANNSFITSYLLRKGGFVNKKVPAGDGGISFGQIGYVLANSWDKSSSRCF